MSLWKKMTGKSWAKHRGIVATVGGAVVGAITGGVLAAPGAVLAGALTGASAGAAVGGSYQTVDAQRQNEKSAKAAAQEAEAAAGSGHAVDSVEAAATVDSAGNAAWKRKQQALAAGVGTGRGGTRMTSNLGGSGKLG